VRLIYIVKRSHIYNTQLIAFIPNDGPSVRAIFWITEWDEKEEGNEAVQQWEDDWDDDDVNDDFSLQLRKELESNLSKN
jgi:hypothetical protein